MHIQVIGAGAIGMLVAGKLSLRGGVRTELVARTAAQREELERKGLTVYDGETEATAALEVSAFAEGAPSEGAGEPDWLLLAVKQKDIDEPLMRFVRGRMGGKTKLLCWQNGVGHAERLSRHVPASRIYLAVTTEGARKLSHAEVRHTGVGTTHIGPYAAEEDGEAGARDDEKKLIDALRSAGFACTLSKHIHTQVWNKLLINAVINPLTAILAVPNGRLPALAGGSELMRALYDEAVAALAAGGHPVADDAWEQLLEVCRLTARNRSSMLRDIEEGRATEIDWITGSLLALADSHGVAVPTHRTVYHMIKAMEHRNGCRSGPESGDLSSDD